MLGGEPVPHAGSSPRRRGAQVYRTSACRLSRIIPAQAGSTTPGRGIRRGCGDHPRAGGEHSQGRFPEPTVPGSSPRRRGAPVLGEPTAPQSGISPAQAGSTACWVANQFPMPDHPRAGGEHAAPITDIDGSGGSSPRRRGAQVYRTSACRLSRIIPAQAGSTTPGRGIRRGCGDHPRAGGEHGKTSPLVTSQEGSSPRRRGAPHEQRHRHHHRRIIPAQAGSTSEAVAMSGGATDHPRAGGEHSLWPWPKVAVIGSSPRRRGALVWAWPRAAAHGIIPAQAGST